MELALEARARSSKLALLRCHRPIRWSHHYTAKMLPQPKAPPRHRRPRIGAQRDRSDQSSPSTRPNRGRRAPIGTENLAGWPPNANSRASLEASLKAPPNAVGAVSHRRCWRTLLQCGVAYAERGGREARGARRRGQPTECGGAANKRSESTPTSKSSHANFSRATSNTPIPAGTNFLLVMR